MRSGLRLATSLIVETGEARDDHQVAALLGFGADAVSPYLTLEAVAGAVRNDGDAADAEVLAAQIR